VPAGPCPTDRPVTTSHTPAVHAAIRILRGLRESPEPIGVSEVARLTGLNKSTVHGIMRTLVAEEFLTEVAHTKRYRLGAALVELAEAVRGPRAGVALARPYLDELARELNLACFLAVPYAEREFLLVERAESSHGIRVTVSVGERFPLTAGALGKAYLAWQPTPVVLDAIARLRLPTRTPTSIRRTSRYLEELAKVRAQGFGESYGEYQTDTNALAAPVFGASGNIALLLLTVGFPRELPLALMKRHGRRLREVADRVTRTLGGVQPARQERSIR